ncbi:MAG: DUF721 domain-containing protein [Elusimicrobiota bacterium]|nr:DUF721 domain-containing protein [Elusimicrobiota bacterium]
MFTPSKEIVKDLFEKYGITKDIYQLYEIWDKELGKLSKRIKMAGIKGKTILVKADNPVYRQELRLRKQELLRKLNDYFGYRIVNEIKFI